MGPFTREVTKSLDYLRQVVAEVEDLDQDLGSTMTAIVDDLVTNLENQMLLVFANSNFSDREREAALEMEAQKAANSDILGYYKESLKQVSSAQSDLDAKKQNKVIDAAPGKGVPPDVEALRSVSTSMYMVLESLAHHVQAERAFVYMGHKGTGTLRVVTSVPDVVTAQKGRFIPMHQGVAGVAFCTEVGIRVDSVDEDMRRQYVAASDAALRIETSSTLTFPIVTNNGQTVGVVECINKAKDQKWSEADEASVFHAAVLLAYMMSGYDIDFTQGYTYSPGALHTFKPYRPSAYHDVLEGLPQALASKRKQLIARVVTEKEMPLAVKGPDQPLVVDNAKPISRLLDVKEMKTYLKKLDQSHFQSLQDVVEGRQREDDLRGTVESLEAKCKVLDDNVNYLEEQLQDSKRRLMRTSFNAGNRDANYADFAGSGELATSGTEQYNPHRRASIGPNAQTSGPSSRRGSLVPMQLPPIVSEKPSPALKASQQEPSTLQDFLFAASSALESLKTSALVKDSPALRARQFTTPQPHSNKHSSSAPLRSSSSMAKLSSPAGSRSKSVTKKPKFP